MLVHIPEVLTAAQIAQCREALEAALENFPATVLLVSHDRALLDAVAEVVASREPIPLRIQGGGAFPSPYEARVAWMGVDGDADALVPVLEEEGLYLLDVREPDEVAEAAVMLARNSYITGQTVNVNGGWVMS